MYYSRQIVIFRKFIKEGNQGIKNICNFLCFWQKEYAIKLLLLVENNKAN